MIRIAAALALLAAMAGAAAADPAPPITSDVPHFVEEAAAAGIDHAYTGPWEYFVGGGVATFDCDGDRRPDLFMAGGSSPAALYRNRSATGSALAFEKVDLKIPEEDGKRVLGAYPLDIDNDGFIDLAVLRLGNNLLLKGGPDCSFEIANRAFSFDGGKDWTTAFAANWESNQRYPTLAFGNYVDRHAPGAPWGTCADNELLRPAPADGPVYDDPIRLTPGYCTLSMLFTDWNQSG
ncbi:MAG: VCBS repeat-containing protein, partial [Bauldia sp.]|nr:VCBS repeat-containing protein [Bauldia sp.]